MPILARFLPSDAQLNDMAIARALADPPMRRRLERSVRIRHFAANFMMALPAYFVGGLAQLVNLHFFYHFPIPPIFWIREPVLLLITSWLAYEFYFAERSYRRFGL